MPVDLRIGHCHSWMWTELDPGDGRKGHWVDVDALPMTAHSGVGQTWYHSAEVVAVATRALVTILAAP
jgi:hypothetical protein